MDIRQRREGCYQVIAILGSADVSASPALREALLGTIESGTTRIVCDLRRADFIGSDALGVLITAYLKARGRGGCVRLAAPGGRPREILQTTRLDHLFDIYPDVECAVKA
jgi:anti-sigma B factor antagonist